RGVTSTVEGLARYTSRYSARFTNTDTILTVAANITRPAIGPSTISSFRFITPFIEASPSLGLAGAAFWRRRGARLPFALELSHVGDDCPPVGGRDRPLVPGHQPCPVGDDVEDLAIGVVEDLLLVKGRRGDVAPLEQDPLAVAAGIVARLAINRVALAAALDERRVHRHRNLGDELTVRAFAREEGRVLSQPADRHGSRNGLTHRRAVEEELAG